MNHKTHFIVILLLGLLPIQLNSQIIKKRNKEYVLINDSIGKSGDMLSVWRFEKDHRTIIGTIQVFQISDNQTFAKILNEISKNAVSPSDSVTTDFLPIGTIRDIKSFTVTTDTVTKKIEYGKYFPINKGIYFSCEYGTSHILNKNYHSGGACISFDGTTNFILQNESTIKNNFTITLERVGRKEKSSVGTTLSFSFSKVNESNALSLGSSLFFPFGFENTIIISPELGYLFTLFPNTPISTTFQAYSLCSLILNVQNHFFLFVEGGYVYTDVDKLTYSSYDFGLGFGL